MLKEHLLEEHDYKLENFQRELSIEENYHFADSKYLPEESKKVWDVKRLNGAALQPDETDTDESQPEGKYWHAAVDFVRDQLLPSIWYFPNFLFDLPKSFEVTTKQIPDDDDSRAVYQTTLEHILHEVDPEMTLAKHIIERTSSKDPADKESLEAVLLDLSLIHI